MTDQFSIYDRPWRTVFLAVGLLVVVVGSAMESDQQMRKEAGAYLTGEKVEPSTYNSVAYAGFVIVVFLLMGIRSSLDRMSGRTPPQPTTQAVVSTTKPKHGRIELR